MKQSVFYSVIYNVVLFTRSNVKTINFTVLTLNTIKSHCCGLGIGLYVEAADVAQCFIQTP